MAMVAFYAGLLIGVVTGIVFVSLYSMVQQGERVQETDQS